MIGWKITWLFQVNRLKFTNPDTPKQVIFSSASHQNYILKGAHHTVANQGSVSHFSRSFAKDGVPRPVTGSHPGTALKPGVLHPGLFPDVMSWKAEEKASEYICDEVRLVTNTQMHNSQPGLWNRLAFSRLSSVHHSPSRGLNRPRELKRMFQTHGRTVH